MLDVYVYDTIWSYAAYFMYMRLDLLDLFAHVLLAGRPTVLAQT